MKYIYTSKNCPRCEDLKAKYLSKGVWFEERSSDRIKNPKDKIDQDALIQASIQNMELPVEVEKEEIEYECPQCGEEIIKTGDGRLLVCVECDFTILLD